MTRQFGSKQPSVASKRAAAVQYLVLAKSPTIEGIMSFGVSKSAAMILLAEEEKRRIQIEKDIGNA